MSITVDALIAKMDWAARNGLTDFVIEHDGSRIALSLSNDSSIAPVVSEAVSPRSAHSEPVVVLAELHGIAAPLSGLCQLSADDDAAPFVAIGDRVIEGQTLCLIEAMKLMTAVTADCTGTVADVCVTDKTEVEAGQIVIKVKT